ncbi:hypothetical protein RhiirA1_470842 [Rhizophagus irregularis]|uniref:Uncharacterized protein n=3 Tax=Rhizophagus irregularis TaxID=588596 RepID=U9U3C7_RHIID|nr:hypothetical protein GLOIN_2v1482151 [Rhizophagus irregularis DAOM 181602=DAOM 197198]EXX53160.1 hypothetical protein RirG_246600 [Rhizophagus irregularis DAOM 197198w]PKC58520.1 hypothetical protein RhiirA1_470842 [Rhizophagus irregularis]POG66633.1 hypothetical protein GLOIN_2v1482151 [Rhizophagus irregularis DAOM 181602=DAOM 197198]UZO09023.1 hypothetical protein OCT59_029263 [Rhizophagus irregularis]CAB4480965.1 unnamed protein product [Rhizophagus irregularis]|eukprot:XP_025173499.1 hypothetical protein GLOIN_2v1482151 [Rhizophagus irregularis DAOM 181602=DAOM 197198]
MGSKRLVFLLLLFFVSIVSPACTTFSTTCDYQTACACPKSNPQGTYCGSDIGCDHTHVYECNPNGGECTTCDYGLRFSCANCGKLACPKAPPPPPPQKQPNEPVKQPTKTPETKPPSLPPAVCSNPITRNFVTDFCIFVGTQTMVLVTTGWTIGEITATCVAVAAPFALETLGGSESICLLVVFLATEAVAAGLVDPACNNIC